MAQSDVGLIAQAISQIAQLWTEYLKSADKRKADKCIEAGELIKEIREV